MEISSKEKIKHILNDPNRKNLFQIIWEFSMASLREKRIAKEYFSRFVYRKGSKPLSNYLTDKEIGVLQTSRILHSDASADLLVNKLKFYQFCVEHDIPTPKILAYSVKSKLHDFNKVYDDLRPKEFKALVDQWLASSPHRSIFLKPTSSKGGEGAYKIDPDDLLNLDKLTEVYAAVLKKDYIIQETVVQHATLSAINPAAINTLRIDTYTPRGEKSRVMSALVRFGRLGYVVDNQSGTSGFFIAVDLKTHQLRGPGIQLTASGNALVTHHPDTEEVLDGVLIPYVDEAIALVNRAADLVEDRLIGWDVCIGVDGPIIIEGNHNYHMVMQEIAYGGYRNHPEFIKVMKEENLL